jgi:hypothetical protein
MMLDENRLHAPPEMDVDVAYLAPLVGDLAKCAIDVAANEIWQGQAQSESPTARMKRTTTDHFGSVPKPRAGRGERLVGRSAGYRRAASAIPRRHTIRSR